MEEELTQVKRKSTVRRTSKQIIKLLKDFASREDMTIVEFCKLNNVKKSNFYNWQKRYSIKESKPDKAKGFVPIKLTPSLCSDSSPSLFAEVKGIRLYQVVSSEYLRSLLS